MRNSFSLNLSVTKRHLKFKQRGTENSRGLKRDSDLSRTCFLSAETLTEADFTNIVVSGFCFLVNHYKKYFNFDGETGE